MGRPGPACGKHARAGPFRAYWPRPAALSSGEEPISSHDTPGSCDRNPVPVLYWPRRHRLVDALPPRKDRPVPGTLAIAAEDDLVATIDLDDLRLILTLAHVQLDDHDAALAEEYDTTPERVVSARAAAVRIAQALA